MTKVRISLDLPSCAISQIEKSHETTWAILSPEQVKSCQCASAVAQRIRDGIDGKDIVEPLDWVAGLKKGQGIMAVIYERSDCKDCPC